VYKKPTRIMDAPFWKIKTPSAAGGRLGGHSKITSSFLLPFNQKYPNPTTELQIGLALGFGLKA
jgi:hypothetical protein